MSEQRPAIGWIGTGVMGAPMCAHLLAAGYELAVHSRTQERVKSLVASGASWYNSPAEVAAVSDVVFTMVGTPQEVRAIYFGSDGLFTATSDGAVIIDMGTTPPGLTMDIAARATELGASTIDAPVSGGDVGARSATLSIMAGGDAEVIEKMKPLFECLGKVEHMGGTGSGQHTKMCNQITVAGTMIGVCESLVYAARAGVDAERLVATISKGAAACWTLDNLAPRINRDDYAPGFMVDHFVKDLGIALNELETMQLELPGLKLAHELYQKTQNLGYGASGTQALIKALAPD